GRCPSWISCRIQLIQSKASTMTSLSKNKPFYRQLGMSENPYPDGAVGIEVELEGSLFGHGSRHKFWTVKSEASLRNGGMEYVLRKPVDMGELPAALKEFGSFMIKSSPKSTIRCSTHIHVSI